jgi:hypothetical protein
VAIYIQKSAKDLYWIMTNNQVIKKKGDSCEENWFSKVNNWFFTNFPYWIAFWNKAVLFSQHI